MSSALIVMCGRSFSGKSTIARAIAATLDADVVNFDQINEQRGLDGGAGIPVEEWQRTHAIATERVLAALHDNRVVIVDDTNSWRFLRDGWRDLAERETASYILLYVDTPADEVRRRRDVNRIHRSRHEVADPVFEAHLADFDEPGADESHTIAPAVADIPVWAHTLLA
ncbi:MAG TPA: ATP-binding protein [Galbitalea sp.]